MRNPQTEFLHEFLVFLNVNAAGAMQLKLHPQPIRKIDMQIAEDL